MTNADKILTFLQKYKSKCFCDDCLSDLASVKRRQQVNQICNRQNVANHIVTNFDIPCSICDKVKITRKIK